MPKMRFHIKEAWILATGIAIDRITKLLALKELRGGEVVLLPGLIKLRLLFNEGSAFGIKIIKTEKLWIIITSIFVILLYILPVRDRLSRISRGLLISGAVGNLLDRIIYKKVIDFITLPHWPTFNVADILITVGITLALISLLRRKENENTNTT